jgi:Ca2+-binding RTX toxin-like protein
LAAAFLVVRIGHFVNLLPWPGNFIAIGVWAAAKSVFRFKRNDMTTPVLSGDRLIINPDVVGGQTVPKLSALSDGRFVAVWVDEVIGNTIDIKAQIVLADGTPVGETFTVHNFSDTDQTQADITTLANGGFVVTWTTAGGAGGDGSLDSVKARVFDSAGVPVGDEFQVNTITNGRQNFSTVTALDDGGFAVTFQTPTGNNDIAMRLFDADGTPRGAQFVVADGAATIQRQPDVTTLDNGNLVVVWQQAFGAVPDTSLVGIAARIFTAAGVALGPAFGVNTTTAGDQLDAEVAALSGGGFVVTWMDNSRTGGDTSFNAVRAQRFDDAGAKLGGEILVNTTTSGNQNAPAIVGLSDGRFMIAWTDQSAGSWDINAQLYNGDGTPSGSEFLVSGVFSLNQTAVTLTELSDGRVAVGWHGPPDEGGEALDIGGQIIDPREAALNFSGASAGEITVGTRFDDRLSGRGGADKLQGADGNDTLNGGNGRDTLEGGLGADRLIGGTGPDVFVYRDVAESAAAAAGRDTIDGFSQAQDDVIDLSAIDADADLEGHQTFTFVEAAAFTGRGQVRAFTNAANTVIEVNTTGDAAPDMRITLTGIMTLTAADFDFV